MLGEWTSRFLPPAASRAIPRASATSQLKKVTPSVGVVSCGWWVVGEDEDRSLPGAPVGSAPGCGGLVPAVTAAENRTGRGQVLLEQARPDGEAGHPVDRSSRSGHESVDGHREVPQDLPGCSLTSCVT